MTAPTGDGDGNWGLPTEKKGMGTETKVGLVLVVFLLGAFGFVVWKKMTPKSGVVAESFEEPGTLQAGTDPNAEDDRDPASGDFTEPGTIPDDPAGEPVWDEPRRSVTETDPREDDPFADLDDRRTVVDTSQRPPEAGGVEFVDVDQHDPRDTGDFEPVPTRDDRTFADQRGFAEDDGFEDDGFEDDGFVEVRRGGFDDAEPIRQTMAEGDGFDDGDDPFAEDDGFGGFDDEPSTARNDDGFGEAPDDPFGDDDAFDDSRSASGFDDADDDPFSDDGFDDSQPQTDQRGFADQTTSTTRVVQREQFEDDDPFGDGGDAFTEPDTRQQRGFDETPRRTTQSAPDGFGRSSGDPFTDPESTYEQRPQRSTSIDQRGFGGDFTPRPTDANGYPAGTRLHEVASGESYWTISRAEYGTARYYSSLAKYNEHRIPNPKRMRPGMKVLIPPAEVLHRRYPKLCGSQPLTRTAEHSGSTSRRGTIVTTSDGRTAYRVGSRDTLSDIAQKHLGRASRWIQIYELNRDQLKSPNKLRVGAVLRLPADASRVRVATEPGTFR